MPMNTDEKVNKIKELREKYKSSYEIAEIVGLSDSTVRYHLRLRFPELNTKSFKRLVNMRRTPAEDLSNMVFGRLTVIRRSLRSEDEEKTIWECICVCGKTTFVQSYPLKMGLSKSCGCLQMESVTTHGRRESIEYSSWASMIQRCYNSNHRNYKHYGGRGIKVCDRWKESFEYFCADMGPRPSKKHSIDRIDNDGNYTPENCRWATITQQHRNRRNNILLTANGYTMIQQDWIKAFGVSQGWFISRVKRGMTMQEIFDSFFKDFP